MSIDFPEYTGKFIVLITNYTKTPDALSGIREQCKDSNIFSYKGRFVCVRALTKDDLKDEDFVDWLQSMWRTRQKINHFIKHANLLPTNQ